MRHALRKLNGLGRSVIRKLGGPAPFRPDLYQTALLKDIAATSPGGRDCQDLLADASVAFFDAANAAAGFFPVDNVPKLVADYANSHAAWHDVLLAEAERHCNVGLPVYDLQASALADEAFWERPVENVYKDRLYRVRPHRFGFLPRLAMAAAADPKGVGNEVMPTLLGVLERWISHVQRPTGAGRAYFSNLVVIYRLLAISWASAFLAALAHKGDKTAAAVCLRLFQILAADVQYLRPRLGDSVANNHLLADRFAAWFLASCYPEVYPEVDRRSLEQAWQAELARQFQPDGTNFEQSVHYHEIGCEMALVYLVVSLRRGERPTDEILLLIRQMLRFQVALSDGRGNSFTLGDATEDALLPLDADCADGVAAGTWQVLYRALFDGEAAVPDDTAKGAERGYWLEAALPSAQRPMRLLQPPDHLGDLVLFSDNGYALLDDGLSDQKVLFRSGPRPTVAVSPGHAMSDLLSVYWTVCGQPVLEASGTYSYRSVADTTGHVPERPRDYFRSPAAHNCLVLAGHDPLGTPTGSFRRVDNGARVTTTAEALSGVLVWTEGRMVEHGPLNGYCRGILQLPGRYTVVYDRLPRLSETDEIACRWQFAPEAEVVLLDPRRAQVDFKEFTIGMAASAGLDDFEWVQGRVEPPAGWVSRRYGEVAAAPQLICSRRPGARDLIFVFGVLGERALFSVEVLSIGAKGIVLQVGHGRHRNLVCLGELRGELPGLPFELDFEGAVLWLELEGETCREVRALGLRRLRADFGLALSAGGDEAQTAGWENLALNAGGESLGGHWRRRSDG